MRQSAFLSGKGLTDHNTNEIQTLSSPCIYQEKGSICFYKVNWLFKSSVSKTSSLCLCATVDLLSSTDDCMPPWSLFQLLRQLLDDKVLCTLQKPFEWKTVEDFTVISAMSMSEFPSVNNQMLSTRLLVRAAL